MTQVATPERETVKHTPRAEAFGFVGVMKADTKFKAAGEYKIRVKIAADEGGAELFAELSQRAERVHAKAKAEFAKDPKKKAQLKGKPLAEAGCGGYFDEDQNAYIFTFKSAASFVSKKEATKGETITRTIPIFDAKGKKLAADKVPSFGEGSIVKIGYTVSDYAMAAVGAGVSLRLEAVQLIVPKQYEGSGGMGFGDESEGGEDQPAEGGFADESSDGVDVAPAPDDDF